jgi:hypothetical protein
MDLTSLRFLSSQLLGMFLHCTITDSINWQTDTIRVVLQICRTHRWTGDPKKVRHENPMYMWQPEIPRMSFLSHRIIYIWGWVTIINVSFSNRHADEPQSLRDMTYTIPHTRHPFILLQAREEYLILSGKDLGPRLSVLLWLLEIFCFHLSRNRLQFTVYSTDQITTIIVRTR